MSPPANPRPLLYSGAFVQWRGVWKVVASREEEQLWLESKVAQNKKKLWLKSRENTVWLKLGSAAWSVVPNVHCKRAHDIRRATVSGIMFISRRLTSLVYPPCSRLC